MVSRYYGKTSEDRASAPFRCQGFVRNGIIGRTDGQDAGRPVAIASLPPFLRALLVTDGTVTKILEAYFWEPVRVDTLRQECIDVEAAIPWIEVSAGDRVMVRRVQLRGVDTGLPYAHAFSVIRLERIPEGFRQRLIDREIGIGALIRDSGLESYREVMEVGLEGPPSPEVSPDATQDAIQGGVSRTYRIIIAGEPVILITETFPLDLYRSDPGAGGDPG
ncbi:DUF98 domain-containing protein [Thiohalocapsa marina]|uniref:DUF98 domain-containing protein n=1 Tax=Thiohalocapsa marina TaxID=424902 RepID=A0A5M8FU96_9GAMM|nr:chorismate pyruvate-lyase family protein [Thiohalocapsa marina]KAA6187382.1 DUF98 domain-containing protein [Thiohalocapsa marina]